MAVGSPPPPPDGALEKSCPPQALSTAIASTQRRQGVVRAPFWFHLPSPCFLLRRVKNVTMMMMMMLMMKYSSTSLCQLFYHGHRLLLSLYICVISLKCNGNADFCLLLLFFSPPWREAQNEPHGGHVTFRRAPGSGNGNRKT